MRSERLHWLDATKGIGILLVISGHVMDGAMSQHILSGGWVSVLYRLIYMFHMPLFFLLSGYAFASSDGRKQPGGAH